MITAFRRLRNRFAPLGLALAMLTLAACQTAAPTLGTGRAVSGEQINVAVLVPYGSAQPGDDIVARSLENAARLAAGDVTGVSVDITVFSTGGIPAQAAALAEEAVRQGADIIVGPLRSDAAAAVGVAVAGSNVTVLSFSNNTEIAGGNVFVLGNSFDNTAQRMVQYAARQGQSRILILHAETLAGEVARDAVFRAATGAGLTVTQSVGYDFSQSGVVAALPDIIEAVETTQVDAILVTADTTGALPLFAQLLPENGLDTDAVQLIGLTRWDVPAQTLELSGLQGGWFALPDPAASGGFESRYAAQFGEAPHVLAGLGYDAVRAAAETALAQGRLGGRDLIASSGFGGANGVFRLNADGTTTRALAVAEVQDNQVTIIDPAPGSLGAPGF